MKKKTALSVHEVNSPCEHSAEGRSAAGQIEQSILTRTLDFSNRAIIDDESRLVRLSFSSQEEVVRGSLFGEPWVEILGHSLQEVDLSRLNSSAPVLYNHDRSERENRIGVVERAWVENERGYAEIRLSKRSEIDGIWQDVRDGILRNVSVAYRINERLLVEEADNQPAKYRVTSWSPIEISLVDIPADATVGIGRSEAEFFQENNRITQTRKDNHMSKIAQSEANDLSTTNPAINPEQVRLELLEQEKSRRNEIRSLFAKHEQYSSLKDECLDDPDIDITEARRLLLEAIGKDEQPIISHQRIEVLQSDAEKFSRMAEDAIAFRSGIVARDSNPSELVSYTLLEMARKCLELRGIATHHMDKRDLVGRAFTHSTSDFPKILENNARKSMLRGYEEAEEVFQQFTRTGNLSDFKKHTRLGMGVFDTLEEVKEGGEFKHGTIGERHETIQLATYGKLFSITRQAIINDDLSAFTDIPRKMGRAAARTVGDLVWGIITGNPTMADGVALFHATHKNLAGTGTAISAASVGLARTAMRTQKDGKAVLNIRPRYMLVPATLEDKARVLMASETDPAQQNSGVPNPVRGSLEIVVDARLDTASTTAWYLASDPNSFDTIEVGYLDGVSAPFLDSQDGWSIDGVEYKVRIDAAAAPLEFRTMYKNPGA